MNAWDAEKHAQWRNKAEHLMRFAGPGNQVISVAWRARNGWEHTLSKVFPLTATHEEINTWRRGTEWPGHPGGWWNYFKDDMRKKRAKEREKCKP